MCNSVFSTLHAIKQHTFRALWQIHECIQAIKPITESHGIVENGIIFTNYSKFLFLIISVFNGSMPLPTIKFRLLGYYFRAESCVQIKKNMISEKNFKKWYIFTKKTESSYEDNVSRINTIIAEPIGSKVRKVVHLHRSQ